MNKELPANTVLSHYRILAKLGAGGMGEVYLAEDARLRRKVAPKVLPEDLAADTARPLRFEREAHAASTLNHPNILTLHEFGRVGEWIPTALARVYGSLGRKGEAPKILDELTA